VTKTSLESAAHDDDFQEVKRRKRHNSNDTSQTAEKSITSAPKSAAGRLPTKAMISRNIFAPLRTNDMDTEITGAENTLPEKEAPRKSDRQSPIMMMSTTNFIRLKNDLKDHVKGEYEFRNTRNGICIITKEIVVYSAIESYLEKNNLQYFTSTPNSEKPIKAVIRHLLPDTPAEDISNSLESLGFRVINMRQLTTNRRAPNRQTHLESLPLFLVTLIR
jgi:hemin uptake protein HemP